MTIEAYAHRSLLLSAPLVMEGNRLFTMGSVLKGLITQ